MGAAPDAGALEWGPEFVDISATGDLGFTFGPYTAKNNDGLAVGWGEYVSMWQRQPDGTLRVALDVGISSPEPDPGDDDTHLPAPALPAARRVVDTIAEAAVLMDLDRQGTAALSETGHATSQTRVFRNGSRSHARSVARDSIPPSPESWEPAGGAVAESGDLG